MKKVIIAAMVAVGLLAGCQNRNTAAVTDNSGNEREVQKVEHAPGLIVYVHTDSLIMGYNMATDLNSDFRAKYEKAEASIKNKQGRFERDYMDYQEKAQKGLATRFQLEEMGQKLQQQDMQLRQDAERLMTELAEEEQVINNKIFFSVTDYLKELNADNRYAMIISTTTSGPILHADPSLSITQEVLKALNERYDREKAAK